MTFEEQLQTNGKLIYTNKGFSMMPLLREDRDIMVIEACKPCDLKSLDAVLFVRPFMEGRGHYVLHRILRVNPDGTYWIVGDNCVSGETVPGERILGRLTSVIRDGRTVNVTDLCYRLYVNLWCRPYHMRFFLLRCRAFAGRVKRYIKRRITHAE